MKLRVIDDNDAQLCEVELLAYVADQHGVVIIAPSREELEKLFDWNLAFHWVGTEEGSKHAGKPRACLSWNGVPSGTTLELDAD